MSMISELVSDLRGQADFLQNLQDWSDMPDRCIGYLREAADTIEDLSAKIHAIQMERSLQYYNGGWIPCEDRMPEYIGVYLVCFDDGYIASVEYGMDVDRMDWLLWQEADEVLAWMPLPEPYKEGE